MNEVSIIINGTRYDAVEEKYTISNSGCAFYSYEKRCWDCIIGMDTCERLIGVDGVFKESPKSFER